MRKMRRARTANARQCSSSSSAPFSRVNSESQLSYSIAYWRVYEKRRRVPLFELSSATPESTFRERRAEEGSALCANRKRFPHVYSYSCRMQRHLRRAGNQIGAKSFITIVFRVRSVRSELELCRTLNASSRNSPAANGRQ